MRAFVSTALAVSFAVALVGGTGCATDSSSATDGEPPTDAQADAPAEVRGPSPGAEAPGDYRADLEAWRARRVEGLTRPEGWLSLVGLYWLEEGPNPLGSDPGSHVVLPAGKAPAHAGVLYLEAGTVRIDAAPDSGITQDGEAVGSLRLLADADEEGPTVLELGDLVFYVIQRVDDFGVRIKDRESPARHAFEEIPIFPVDPTWNIEARFEPYEPVRHIPVPNIIGTVFDEVSPGALVFEREGTTYRLDTIAEAGDDRLFIIFADQTTGKETYGGGRYIYVDRADAQGRVMVDFNRAYNPPCVFTAFATCPLPPKDNRLAMRVEAGEKLYQGPTPH
jgi:hypothetical protein